MSWYVRFTAPAFDDPEVDAGHDPPAGHTGPVPPGLAFAEHLIRRLRAGGWPVDNRWTTDYSHAFDVHEGGHRFDVMVLPPTGESRRWAVHLERRRGLLERFTSGRPDPAVLLNLCRAIHDVLRRDPAVAEIRWFHVDEWSGADGPGGRPEPPSTG